jgi:hypothetical protein
VHCKRCAAVTNSYEPILDVSLSLSAPPGSGGGGGPPGGASSSRFGGGGGFFRGFGNINASFADGGFNAGSYAGGGGFNSGGGGGGGGDLEAALRAFLSCRRRRRDLAATAAAATLPPPSLLPPPRIAAARTLSCPLPPPLPGSETPILLCSARRTTGATRAAGWRPRSAVSGYTTSRTCWSYT